MQPDRGVFHIIHSFFHSENVEIPARHWPCRENQTVLSAACANLKNRKLVYRTTFDNSNLAENTRP